MYKQGLAIRFLVGRDAGFENGKNGTNGAKGGICRAGGGGPKITLRV